MTREDRDEREERAKKKQGLHQVHQKTEYDLKLDIYFQHIIVSAGLPHTHTLVPVGR